MNLSDDFENREEVSNLRTESAVATLGMGLAAETHSHDTPEYGDVVARNRAAKGAQA